MQVRTAFLDDRRWPVERTTIERGGFVSLEVGERKDTFDDRVQPEDTVHAAQHADTFSLHVRDGRLHRNNEHSAATASAN